MNSRKLTVALGLSLAAPLVFAQAELGGNSTNVNATVAGCTSLVEQEIPSVGAGNFRYCTAVGSSDVVNPNQVGSNLYAFNLTLNDMPVCAPGDGGAERTLQFNNVNAMEWDNRLKPVASTQIFRVSETTSSFIRWTARPLPGSPATIVLDSSLSVVCSEENVDRLPYTPIPDDD